MTSRANPQARLSGSRKKVKRMINVVDFKTFLETLCETNRHLDFYVDWHKCLKNRDDIAISLNHLNFLLGKHSEEIKEGIKKLYAIYPQAFEVLPILIAKRDNKIFLDSANQECCFSDYLKDALSIFDFFLESNLIDIFTSRKIKDLNDYVFGVEVGLDTHARKNRSGKLMEVLLANVFQKNNIAFEEQVSIDALGLSYGFFGSDTKRFDFSIKTKDVTYVVECNFYTSSGSKLNETARSYRELSEKVNQIEGYRFVWITDGRGWIEAKNKIEEAYKKVEIYNLKHLHYFIKKLKQ